MLVGFEVVQPSVIPVRPGVLFMVTENYHTGSHGRKCAPLACKEQLPNGQFSSNPLHKLCIRPFNSSIISRH